MLKRIIEIAGEEYLLKWDEFDEEIDIDTLLKIDYSNLIGEIVNFPVIVNKFGQMLAELESKVSEAKLNLEVWEAKKKERLRTKFMEENNGKSPTVEWLNNALLSSPEYAVMKKKLIELQKDRDYLNSIFWSAKDKSNKLDRMSLTIQDNSVSSALIETRANGVLVKKIKKG